MVIEDYPKTLLELESRFATEETCREYLLALRWPDGFICPRCGGTKVWALESGRLLCRACRYHASVTAGTVFQDTHLPLTLWFRVMWHVASQKNGASALGIQRVLGIGSYKTAWAVLHKLRRAMVRPGRERLHGVVEVDDSYWGADEEGLVGRRTVAKALLVIAAEVDGEGIGRIRLRRVPNLSHEVLHGFIAEAIEPGSTVCTDGLSAYMNMKCYVHDRRIQGPRPKRSDYLLPRAHRVVSLLKRWLLGTHQGAISHDHLDDYLNEFTFRFNRRASASRGKLFFRLAQQAMQVEPVPFRSLVTPQPVGGG